MEITPSPEQFLNLSSRCSIFWRFGRDIWQHSLFYLFFSRRLAWYLYFVVIFLFMTCCILPDECF